MKTQRALKIRLYPNETQKVLLLKTFGCCRFIYNAMLSERKEVYEKLKDNKRELYEYDYKTEKQYKEEFEWLSEVDSTSLQQARMDLSHAYQNFFRKLKDPKIPSSKKGFPKFKRKHSRNSYRTPQNGNNLKLDFNERKIKLPKLGWVPFRDPRILENYKINSITVSKTTTDKFYASVQYEVDVEEPKHVDLKTKGLKVKGLDMSLTNFFVDDEGNSPLYHRNYRENEMKLSSLQSRLDKTTKKSDKKKLRMRINRIQEHLANRRRDFIEKLSHELTRDNDVIVVESLSLKDMAKFHYGKSVFDCAWGTFLSRLKQKARERGKIVIQADRWFASSKTCNVCGYVNKDLSIENRVWICPKCGMEHNRDQNAGINLKNYGLEILTAGTAGLADSVRESESQPSSMVW